MKARTALHDGMEKMIGSILFVGVMSSVAFIFAGYLWRWANTGHWEIEYQLASTNFYRFWIDDLRQVFRGGWRPRLLVNLGIAILMATPYVRVLASVIYFIFVEKNFKYTVITMFVFGVLTYSLFFGAAL